MATNTGTGIAQVMDALFSLVGSLFKNNSVKSQAEDIGNGGVLSSVAGKYLGTNLTGAEREANAFTTSERLAAQDWSEDMYNKYYSPQAQITSQIAGFQQNGINPALMYGGSAPTAGSMPSSPAGSSVSPSSANLFSAITSMLGLKNERQRIENDYKLGVERNKLEDRRVAAIEALNPSRIEANYASAWRDLTAGNLNEIDSHTRGEMNNARIQNLYSMSENAQSQAALARSGISVNDARIGLLAMQAVNTYIMNTHADAYWSAVVGLTNAQKEANYMLAAKYQSELEYIDRLAMNADKTYEILEKELEQKGYDLDISRFNSEHKGISYWFNLGTQAANSIANLGNAAASLGRTGFYGASVLSGLPQQPAPAPTTQTLYNDAANYFF